MTPTWYDLLGVERTATTDEVRAAWKAAIADLEPGDRRFRALNEAAETLLDPERRAAYDATLEPEPTPEPTPEPDPEGELTRAADAEPAPARGGTVPGWLLAGLAVLVVLLAVATGYLLTQPSDDDIADGASQAQGAAERAATVVLAYDYRTLDQDQQEAGALMTSSYRTKYDDLFTQIAANAPDLKVVVTADVVASGLVRVGADRVQVLVFVNRPTTRADDAEPVVYRDQVVMTMVESDGTWLVDDMDTNQLAG